MKVEDPKDSEESQQGCDESEQSTEGNEKEEQYQLIHRSAGLGKIIVCKHSSNMADISSTCDSKYVGYYRSKDPLENFKIRITLQKIKTSSLLPPQHTAIGDNGVEMQTLRRDDQELDHHKCDFTWQEKRFSQKEINFYSNKANCHSFLHEKYHDKVLQISRSEKPFSRLFSYTSAETMQTHSKLRREGFTSNRGIGALISIDFLSNEHDINVISGFHLPYPLGPVTTSPNENNNYLTRRMQQLHERSNFSHPTSQRIKAVFPNMNIIDDSPTEESKLNTHGLNTHVQSMFLMADLRPQNSSEEVSDEEDEFILCKVTVDNNNVISISPDFNSNLKNPYLIEYRRNGVKESYYYTIENVSNNISENDKLQDEKLHRELCIRHSEFLSSCVGSTFDMFEPKYATDEEGEESLSSSQSNSEDDEKASRISEQSWCDLSDISAKNFEYDNLYVHFFVQLAEGWTASDDCSLSHVTQICRTKCDKKDRRTYAQLADSALTYNVENLEINWKIENLQAFILIMKHSNIPVFKHGKVPGQWTYQYSSIMAANMAANMDGPCKFFRNITNSSSIENFPKWPILYLEVLSLDSWGRFRTEGYGHTVIPSTPGPFCKDIHTWRPLSQSVVGELRRFFIGGSPRLEDLTYATIPSNFEGNHLSKLGFKTATSGSVTVKMNIIHQSQAYLTSESHKKKMSSLIERLGAATIQSGVAVVLVAFQRARQRMIAARKQVSRF
ncbi:Meckel syndrome type 1 protein [Nymphon striatum]|nr:Meckel syndrome type 1 protein [Nymphon striatum]